MNGKNTNPTSSVVSSFFILYRIYCTLYFPSV